MERTEHCGYLDMDGLSHIQKDLHQCRSANSPTHSSSMIRSAASASRTLSVGIVGAGFAGLRCADVLLQHGCRVTIFEARNRLGGRVAQSNQIGHPVDLGPNWIHGTNDNPILEIAIKTSTRLHTWSEDSAIIGPDGEPLTATEADAYSSLLWDDGLIAEAFRYSNEHSAEIDPERSLYDFFAERAEGLFATEPEDVAKRKRGTLLQVASMWGAYTGSPVTRQSLKFFWMEECIQGENPFVAGTYEKILEYVARPAREGAEIRLKTEVVRIVSSDGSEEAGVRKKPCVHLADGHTREFDEVVVTAPLGWLKRNKAAFEPALPPRLSQAIDNIGYGTLDKVYITFPSAFWDTPPASTHESSTGNGSRGSKGTPPNLTAAANPFHQAPTTPDPSAPEQEHYAASIHWLAPSYAPKTNPQHWDPQALNLATLPRGSAHPTLLFYTFGPCSEHLASLATTHAADPAARDAALLAFFHPYFSRLPNYTSPEEDPACEPTAVLATAWAGDKFAGYGSYCNFPVGSQDGRRDVECMRRGMPERGVWLAGEHTAPFVALGTSTGAYWSGEGVAGRVLDATGFGGRLEGGISSESKA
ncbi:hypothetical protein LTR53_007172 [Teratosphaeriaceae sp. CCFEE 6253]|nr:hypothetical protein LTR53_007172 [Teratosphaeriaceae sp. CCFEE 6253]